MQSQSEHSQPFGQGYTPSTSSPDQAISSSSLKSEVSQDAMQYFLTNQQRFDLSGNQSPLSASADQSGSGYVSSSAQSASGEIKPDGSNPSSSTPGSRRPSTLGRKTSEGHRGQKHRWSAEETQALVDGCNKHGVGNWKKILSDPELSGLFSDRTAGDLKDRFRTYFPDAYHEMYPNAKTHLSKAVRGRDAEGKSIFEKGKTKERRPFTPEEDAALRAGYQQYGSHWALIAKNPIFNGQRRAIDLRDRFRNAFPEDYERAGFKPRPSKARKDRGPSASKPGEGHPARQNRLPSTHSDASLSEGAAWRGSDYPLSDHTSDGHLTDHGNLTDYSYFTDQGNLTDYGNLTDGGQDQVFSGPSGAANSALARSNSTGNANVASQAAQNVPNSFGQAFALQAQHAQAQPRPPFFTSNTAPLPGAGVPFRASDMVTGQSIHSLFEQLQQASLEGPSTSSETGSIHERVTPPSASESDLSHQQQFLQLHQGNPAPHPKMAPADDMRRQAGKQSGHDAASHKRRSHVTRTGKNSALERLPSVHSHLHHVHGHGHAHASSYSRPQSQASSGHHSPAGGALPLQSDASLSPLSQAVSVQPDVLAWLNPGLGAASMDINSQQAPSQDPASWSAYSSGASDASAGSLNASVSGVFLGNRQAIFGTGMGFSSRLLPAHADQLGTALPGMSAASDSSSSSRRSSAHDGPFALRQQPAQQASSKPVGDQQTGVGGNFQVDPMQNFANPLSNAADMAQWNVDWDLGSISDSGLQNEDVNDLLASLPLSHHPWAGDLHHGTTPAGSSDQFQSNVPLAGEPQAAPRVAGQNQLNSGLGFNSAGEGVNDGMLNHISATTSQTQQQQTSVQPGGSQNANASGPDVSVSFASVTYGDPLIREEREHSPDSLELQREQTFTAKDVGKGFVRDVKDDEESDDDNRRRSTDTLRRAEGALEAALESVEDTRALAFAQQFSRDHDSDEDSDEEADDAGYEEDEEDDDEPEYGEEIDTSDYDFQQVLDDLQASQSNGLSSDFFDGPFGDNGGVTPGAPGQSDLVMDDNTASGNASYSSQTSNSQLGSQGVTSGQVNQMWNNGMSLDRLPQIYMTGMPPSTGVADANVFTNAQAAAWMSTQGGSASPGFVIGPGMSISGQTPAQHSGGKSSDGSPAQGPYTRQ